MSVLLLLSLSAAWAPAGCVGLFRSVRPIDLSICLLFAVRLGVKRTV